MSQEEILERFFVQNPETGLYDRVRKHQVAPRHSHYYDDDRNVWVPVPREEEGERMSRLEELWEEIGWRCVPHGERDCDSCGSDGDCEACPKWEKIAGILDRERAEALEAFDGAGIAARILVEAAEKARDEARQLVRDLAGWLEEETPQFDRAALEASHPWLGKKP